MEDGRVKKRQIRKIDRKQMGKKKRKVEIELLEISRVGSFFRSIRRNIWEADLLKMLIV